MTLDRFVTIGLYVDWDSGTDADLSAYTDVSHKYLSESGITVRWGRDQARSFAPPVIETIDFVLDNTDGTFSNAAGPMAGFITKGPPISYRVFWDTAVTVDDMVITVDSMTVPVDGSITIPFFTGSIDTAEQIIGPTKSVGIRGIGVLRWLTRNRFTIPLLEDTLLHTVIKAILDATSFYTLVDYDLDVSDTVIKTFYMNNELPLPVLLKLIPTEGGNSAIYCEYGLIQFENANHRLIDPRSTDVMWYLFDKLQSVDPLRGKPIYHSPPTNLNANSAEVYNKVVSSTNSRVLATQTAVWNYGSTITLAPGETRTIIATLSVVARDILTPVAATDFSFIGGGSLTSISIDFSSGIRIKITMTAHAVNGAVIQGPSGEESLGLKLRGKLKNIASVISVEDTVDTTASESRYELNVYNADVYPEISGNELQDVVNSIARRYKLPRDQATITVYNLNADNLGFILMSRISDRIHIVSTHQGIDHDYFIETKELTTMPGNILKLTLGCERAFDETSMRFGPTDNESKFGTGQFGE